VGIGKVRLQAQRFLHLGNGFLRPALGVQGQSQIAVGIGEVRLQAQRLLELNDGFPSPARASAAIT